MCAQCDIKNICRISHIFQFILRGSWRVKQHQNMRNDNYFTASVKMNLASYSRRDLK